jgi:hypothetical protein
LGVTNEFHWIGKFVKYRICEYLGLTLSINSSHVNGPVCSFPPVLSNTG